MLRNWLIGSVIFHILFLAGAGVCLPCLHHVKPDERYLQLYTEPVSTEADWEATALPQTDIREEKTASAVKQTPPLIRKKAPTQPAGPQPAAVFEQKRENQPAPMKQTIAIEPVKQTALSEKAASAPKSETMESIQVSGLHKPGTQIAADPGVPVGPVYPKGPVQLANIPPEKAGIPPETDPVVSEEKSRTNLPTTDTDPVKYYCPQPKFPDKARRNNWEGIVVLLIEVGADGKVDNIAVFNSSGYEILDDAAKKAARKWRFKPALKYGEPVRRQTKIWFNFNLEG